MLSPVLKRAQGWLRSCFPGRSTSSPEGRCSPLTTPQDGLRGQAPSPVGHTAAAEAATLCPPLPRATERVCGRCWGRAGPRASYGAPRFSGNNANPLSSLTAQAADRRASGHAGLPGRAPSAKTITFGGLMKKSWTRSQTAWGYSQCHRRLTAGLCERH